MSSRQVPVIDDDGFIVGESGSGAALHRREGGQAGPR